MFFTQVSSDERIMAWVKILLKKERDVILTEEMAFSLLDDTRLIHLARMLGAGDPKVKEEILMAYDMESQRGTT